MFNTRRGAWYHGCMRWVLALVASLMVGCAPYPPLTPLPPPVPGATVGYASPKYSDARSWLCRPDLASGPCDKDLAATDIHPDGSITLAPSPGVSATSDVDCFYIYPTVDLDILPANHTSFDDVTPMARTTLAQVGRFREVCNLYVPLYRQVTLGAVLFSSEARERRLEIAFSDVADAFAHYLGQYNHGHRIVVIGHSQGAEMAVRLLRRFFDNDAELRARLLLAMPIGGWVEVPKGQVVGATFANLAVCTQADEVGCVVAFHAFREGSIVTPGSWTPLSGNEEVCVNPANIDRNERRWLSGAYLPSRGHMEGIVPGVRRLPTPYLLYRDFYVAQCVMGPRGFRYLAVAEARGVGDARESPIDLPGYALNGVGLHVLDLQFAQRDLIEMIARRGKRASLDSP